jgi:hypothetical protein
MPKLDNWSLVGIESPSLHGNVSDSPNFENGEFIRTSYICKAIDGNHVQTYSGSIYELGTVDPLYERMYPNALQRLIESLNKK